MYSEQIINPTAQLHTPIPLTFLFFNNQHATVNKYLLLYKQQHSCVRFFGWLSGLKVVDFDSPHGFDENNGNQSMDSEADISMFDAFNDAALVDCCFLCFNSNICRRFLYLL
jgi:hypothetical protein